MTYKMNGLTDEQRERRARRLAKHRTWLTQNQNGMSLGKPDEVKRPNNEHGRKHFEEGK